MENRPCVEFGFNLRIYLPTVGEEEKGPGSREGSAKDLSFGSVICLSCVYRDVKKGGT